MTDAEIGAMAAGPEMDLAVADAAGVELYYPDEKVLYHNRKVDGKFLAWRPSTDWRDAMFAAEQIGLFDEHRFARQLWRELEHWHVGEYEGRSVASASTGPLAIARAILRLAGKE